MQDMPLNTGERFAIAAFGVIKTISVTNIPLVAVWLVLYDEVPPMPVTAVTFVVAAIAGGLAWLYADRFAKTQP